MQRAVALLAAVLASVAPAACGDDGAEPGASKEATLVLDFQPNAVHAGIYAALREGYYGDAGVDLEVREPSASTDAPKLLATGRAELAILDIHDLAIARERGLDVVGMLPIVQRPLAAVIAANRDQVRHPRDLEGKTVGVTGLPSDDAVLDSVLAADGASPDSVRRITIGFQAISALAAGKVDAATGFWNAEGVTLRAMGVPTREFRVDRYGAPPYPELILCTSSDAIRADPALVQSTLTATRRGYELVVERPAQALDDLLAEAPELDRGAQEAQLDALLGAHALGTTPPADVIVHRWIRWDVAHGILDRGPHPWLPGAFEFRLRSRASAQ
jgi:NitT/TauT family transport system substrate-binding protein/putative hydroxymethylpyrimidine transport system substrate-binding protein